MRLFVGEIVPLQLQITNGNAGLFPSALVYAADDGTLLATKNLTHSANGLYKDETYTFPAGEHAIFVIYKTFTDAGRTIENLYLYPRVTETFAVDNGASQASVNIIDDFLDTEIAAIKAKTDNLPSDPADASDIAASFTTVNSKLDTIDDFIDTEIAAIKAKTDQLNFTGANVQAIITEAQIDQIVDETWDEVLSGHLTAGTTGKALNDAMDAADASSIADAVWDELLSTHITAGSAAAILIAGLSQEVFGEVDVTPEVFGEIETSQEIFGFVGDQ